jgi:hypothetical protein
MTAISRWISRAGFEPRHGHGFPLNVRKIQTLRSQEFFNPFDTYIRLKSGAGGYTRSEWHFPARAEIFALPYF